MKQKVFNVVALTLALPFVAVAIFLLLDTLRQEAEASIFITCMFTPVVLMSVYSQLKDHEKKTT